ncbi:hypothetical protein ACI65C_005584 [Semiaphis heraclei]
MEVGLRKDSPITYSNGKRLFTIDQKVDALVRIKMTGCSKAEVARSLHVAESTFRGWFKNKDIVMKAEAKYNEMKSKSSSTSSDGYKSDDNSKSFSVDGSDNNSSTYTDEREGSSSRFSSPDPCVSNPVRRSPERLHHHQQHHKLKIKKQQLNNTLSLNNNNNVVGGLFDGGLMGSGLNAGLNGGLNAGLNASLNAGLNASFNASLSASFNASLSASLNASLSAGLNASLSAGLGAAGLGAAGLGGGHGVAGLNGGLNGGLSLNQQQQQLQHQLTQLAHHPIHHNMPPLGSLKNSNVAAAAVAAAAAAAAAADHVSLRLSPPQVQTKINSYFGASPLQTAPLPSSVNFLTPNFTAENSYNKSSSFINTMVTATLMEPQALDLSTHSRNKCKDCKPSLTTTMVTNTTTTAKTSSKILRHNSYRNLYKPYNSRCTDDIVHPTQGETFCSVPRNPPH